MESCYVGTSSVEIDTGSESSISGAAESDDLVLLAANSGILLIRDNSSGFSLYQHSSGVDFSSVTSLGEGNFLLVGEDGVYRYPETVKQGDADE